MTDQIPRNPEQRRLFKRIMDLVHYLEIPTKLAVIKKMISTLKDDFFNEDKKDDN